MGEEGQPPVAEKGEAREKEERDRGELERKLLQSHEGLEGEKQRCVDAGADDFELHQAA